MREIKFRAYDNVTRQMYYDGNLIDGDIMVMNIEGGLQFSNNYNWKNEDFILMQYTGLKDKNGKKIYEGDIVRYYNDEENGVFEVKYNSCRFYGLWIQATFTDISTDLFYLGCSKELEVIGNIYENKELLEEK